MKKTAIILLLMSLILGIFSPHALAQDDPKRELITASHGESGRVRDAVPQRPSDSGVVPLRHGGPPSGQSAQDPVTQTKTTSSVSSNSSSGLNFNGISADGYIPPDTNLSVGDTQIVQIVNVQFEVFSKATGANIYGPAAIHTIFASLGAPCGTKDGGDPVVLYDKIAGRWLISQMQYNNSGTSNWECIAVSQTSDATGKYNVYAFSFGSKLPDYPKFGVWPDAYYFSANMFNRGTTFSGAEACAFPRAAMLAGTSATAVCFQKSTSVESMLPSDLDGSTLPPSGEPNFYLTMVSNGLNLYRFHVDFNNTANSTFTGPVAVQNVAAFTQACAGGTCIPQPGVTQQLDSLGDRLMFRLAYRNFGGYESLVVNHSVATGSAASPNQTGIRWYEIRSPNGTPTAPTAYQASTYAPDATTYRWLGSIAQDNSGNIAVGYSVSDPSTIYPGIRFAGRLATDSINTLEAESTIVNGTASQSGSNGTRWGDYSSMSIDPSDDCTFWYTTEYIAVAGSFNWNTRIAAFRFSGCGAPPAPPAPSGLVATPGNSQVTLAWNSSAGAASYNVYRSTTHGGSYTILHNVTTAGDADTTAVNGTTYYYVVTALNSTNQESGFSNEASATPGPPLAPQGLAANPGNAQVSLTWNTTANTTGYNVYQSVNSGNYQKLNNSPLTLTNYTDTGLTNGTSYCYEVTGVNTIGEGAFSSSKCATPQTQPPPAPTGLTAIAGDTTVNLSWNSAAGAVSYNVKRSTTSGSGYGQVPGANPTTTSYQDSGLTDGTTYYYVVTAVNSSSQESGNSNQASAKPTATLTSITVTPANPSIPKGTTQPFTATGNYSDGSNQNLTSSVTWTSSAPTTATITSAGVATGLASGQTTIGAASGSVNGSTTLTVLAYSIGGLISGPGGPNATVKLTGAATATVTALGDGSYSFGNLGNGSYTVTPTNTGYSFTPSNQPATINGANPPSINFNSATASVAHVQDSALCSGTTGTTLACTINGVTAGHTVTIGAWINANATCTGVSDGTNSYRINRTASSSANDGICIASFTYSSGGNKTVTVTWSGGSGTDKEEALTEISGVNSTEDVAPVGATGSGTTARTNSGTTALANEVAFSVVTDNTGANPATLTEGNGFTLIQRQVNGVNQVGGFYYKILNSVQSISDSWTINSTNWLCTVISLRGS